MPITALPTPPSRSDPTNFAARGDAFLGALPTFATEANTTASEVNANTITSTTNANSSTASAIAAAASATAAAAASTASAWVSGTTYSAGAVVYSPINYLSYRRKTTGGGTTDPSIDTTNWASLLADTAPFSSSIALAQVQASALCF